MIFLHEMMRFNKNLALKLYAKVYISHFYSTFYDYNVRGPPNPY